MDSHAQLVESEQRLRLLLKNNPDLALFQTGQGAIVDSNPTFLPLLGKVRAEAVNHSLANFLPPEKVPLFNQHLMEAFQDNKIRFDTEVKFNGAVPQQFDITKISLMLYGAIVGEYPLYYSSPLDFAWILY